MRDLRLALAASAALVLAPCLALAQQGVVQKSTAAAGSVVGSTAGAAVAGPIGGAVGGVVGGTVGKTAGKVVNAVVPGDSKKKKRRKAQAQQQTQAQAETQAQPSPAGGQQAVASAAAATDVVSFLTVTGTSMRPTAWGGPGLRTQPKHPLTAMVAPCLQRKMH